jgi:hypothetical protein
MKKNKLLTIFRFTATVIFLLLSFFYYYKFIDPSLIDFKQQPLFLIDKNFLDHFLIYPGRITEFINLFILQFFASKFTGSVLMVILIGLSIFLSNRILRKHVEENALFIGQFLTGILLISLHSNYQINLSTDIVLLSVLSFILLYQSIKHQKISIVLPVLTLSVILIFYIFGGTALLNFSIFVIVLEIIQFNKRGWYISIPIVIILTLLLPYVASINSAFFDFKKLLIGIIESDEKDKTVLFLQLSILIILPLFTLLMALKNVITK